MTGYFVTGTDTGVGKTTVSRALLAAATARGLRTRCLKPAESGCARTPSGILIPADAQALWEVTDRGQPRESACLYRFQAAVAPGVAAEREHTRIDLDAIRAHLRSLWEDEPDLLIVEGAGGLLVPLGSGRTIADLAVLVALPLLIVARPGLGTINHTLLTIEAARARSLQVRGVVFCASTGDVDADAVASNAEEIEKASGIQVLGRVPYLPEAPSSTLAETIEASTGLAALLPSR